MKLLPAMERAIETTEKISEKFEPIEYMEARLHVIDAPSMAALKEVAHALDIESVAHGRPKKHGYWSVANLLNPNEPATFYNFHARRQYMMVKDAEKVIPKLPKLLKIWENKMRKEAQKAFAEYGFKEEEAARKREELERRIREARDGVFEIMASPDKYEVWYTNLNRAKLYPFLYFRTSSALADRILRKGVPNFLWIEESEEKTRTGNDDALEKMTNLFGDIYVGKRT